MTTQPDQSLYLIWWKSLATNAEGHGEYPLPRWVAQEQCNKLNKEYEGTLVHWIEPVDTPQRGE